MRILALCLVSYLMVCSINTSASTKTEDKGYEIATEAKQRDLEWGDYQADMKMILRNAEGQESIRELSIKILELMGDGDKSLVVFKTPKDVAGTAFLNHSHATMADEQWLYLPALKRVKRIASRNKSGPFMGSEFAFEDMTSFEVDKYTYNYLRDEPCPGSTELTCFVVEQFPVDKYSGYSRRVTWVDQTEYRTYKSDYYDRKDSLLKVLLVKDFQQYLGKYWRPGIWQMENKQTGKSTVLLWSNYEFKNGFNDMHFNQNAMRVAR